MGLAKGFPVGLIERPMAFNQDIKALVPKEGVSGPFLLYALSFAGPRVLQNVSNAAHGTKRLGQDDLNNLAIFVPPLAEQRAIAAILDAIQSAARKAEVVTGKAIALKRAAMRELFTRGLRGEAQKETEIGLVPESWTAAPVGQLAEVKGSECLRAFRLFKKTQAGLTSA
jgi:type I restriction enzyme, S subunit